ncbi:MAG: outer membrane beta-barrel protein [Thiogranum sp.]
MKLKSVFTGTLLWFCSIGCQAEGWYLGASVGAMDADIDGFDNATNAGFLAGYDVFSKEIFAASIEAEFTTTVSDGDLKSSGINGDWDIDTRAVYVVSRLGDRFYGKVRYGFLWEDFSVDFPGNSQSDSDSSISWGAAVGWMFAEQLGVQADATRVESSIHYWNLGLVYRF